MLPVLVVFLAGGLGSVIRFWISAGMMSLLGSNFPFGTLTVNLLGCLIIGFIAGLPQAAFSLPPIFRFTLMTGFLGGLTTFSSYEYESFLLALNGRPLAAVANLCLSVFAGFAAVLCGFFLVRWISSMGYQLK
jgi:fluoride exporter